MLLVHARCHNSVVLNKHYPIQIPRPLATMARKGGAKKPIVKKSKVKKLASEKELVETSVKKTKKKKKAVVVEEEFVDDDVDVDDDFDVDDDGVAPVKKKSVIMSGSVALAGKCYKPCK